MKIAFLCDIHLPSHRRAPQYTALQWALNTIGQSGAEALIVAGDFTADGDTDAAAFFLHAIRTLPIPAVVQIGNSDLRTPETAEAFHGFASPTLHRFESCTVLTLHDADRKLSAEDLAVLKTVAEAADEQLLLCLHHPVETLEPAFAAVVNDFLQQYPNAHLFYAHLHCAEEKGRLHALPALDPDKAIGGSGISIWDTTTSTLQTTLAAQPFPQDLVPLLGFSAYDPLPDLEWAAEQHVPCIELRPGAVQCDRTALHRAIQRWREAGGRNLSLHAPDVCWDGHPGDEAAWREFIAFAAEIRADRLTIHVPEVSVRDAAQAQNLRQIAAFLAEKLSVLPQSCAIGIENMHMTAGEASDDSRLYGYLPQECLAYAELVGQLLGRPVGINLDIGHARNNAPFSQRYTLGHWYAEVGGYTVGYHIHQVRSTEHGFENHMPFTGFTQPLISLQSFFTMWGSGGLNHVPVILELRPTPQDPTPYRQVLPLFRNAAQQAL